MTLLELLRPQTLEDFIGGKDQIKMAKAYMDGRVALPACLFMGQPGTGKTTLAHLLADHYDLEPVEINGSSDRSKKKLREISRMTSSLSLSGKRKILIMDECENAKTELLLELQSLRCRKIFICNEVDQLNWHFRKKCHQIVFTLPEKHHYLELLDRLDVEVDDETLSEFKSYRNVINWVQGGDASDPLIMSDLDQARAVFAGGDPGNLTISPEDLNAYYLYNRGDPELSSRLGLALRAGARNRVKSILSQQRISGVINRPYIWRPPREERKYRKVYLKVLGFRDD